MRPVAIDVAILLPVATRRRIERLNAACTAPADGGFRFDATHHPHITLGQHFVDADAVEIVRAELAPTFETQPPLALTVTGTRRGRTAMAAIIAPTPELQHLHERVLDTLAAHEVAGRHDAFQVDEYPARDADVRWVTRFRQDSAVDRFDPHITIGISAAPARLASWRFTASEIALCRLGRFCTCRDQVAHWTL
jgi:hypothetical protein